MKILIISYSYYPDLNPRAFRWTSIVEYLSRKNYDITVVTTLNQNIINEDEIEGVEVIRIPENWFGLFRKKMSSVKSKNDQKDSYLNNHVMNRFSSFAKNILKLIYKLTLRNFQWPDYAWTWIGPTKRKISEVIKLKGQFDIMISVAHPFSSHLIARSIKKVSPNTKWIMDNGDPFCFNGVNPNNVFLYNRLNRCIEGSCINQSDAFTVTTEETKEEYQKIFPHLKDKLTVILPLLNPEIEKLKKTKSISGKKNKNSLKMVFVGTLYSEIRNPTEFLRLLDIAGKKISKTIEVDFYGSVNDLDTKGLSFKNIQVFFNGCIDRKTAQEKMLEADVLINIGNQTSYQLPSKLIEYASLDKPILNISSIENDSSKKFLDNYPLSKTINLNHSDKAKLMLGLENFLNKFETDNTKYNHNWLDSYRIENITERYESFFTDKLI